MAEEFYAEHKGKSFYPGLVEFMTSGPIVALVLAKADAIKGWRELMGPTDVFEARVRAPKRCVPPGSAKQNSLSSLGADVQGQMDKQGFACVTR